MSICKGVFPYLAHYLTIEQTISFREDSAEVYSFSTQAKTHFPLSEDSFKIPTIPQEARLSNKKTIRWLLKNRFIPTLRGKEITFVSSFTPAHLCQHLLGHTDQVYAVTAIPQGPLATGSLDDTIKLWNPSTGECLRTLPGHGNHVRALTHLPEGVLVSGGSLTIKIWNFSTGECLRTLSGHEKEILALEPLPNGKLASGAHDNKVKIWDPSTGVCQFTLEGHTVYVHGLASLPEGLLASASGDKTIKIWDYSKGLLVRTIQADTNGIIRALPNGMLVSGCVDFSIKLLNSTTGECVRTLKGHTAGIYDFVYFSNGTLVSASSDSTVKVWNLSTGECLQTLPHEGIVYSLASLPGEILASASQDKSIKLWKLPSFPAYEQIDGGQVLSQCDRAIGLMQLQLVEEGADHPEKLLCPIDQILFQNPHTTDCGHTFNKSAIDLHMQKDQGCPICRRPIRSVIPDYKVKELAEEARHNCPVPAPAHVLQNKDQAMASSCIETGKALAAKGDHRGALKFFKKALSFSSRSEDYAVIPVLFEQQHEILKACLAYLHLAKCQFQEGKYEEAHTTLQKTLNAKLPELIKLRIKSAYAAIIQIQGQNQWAFTLFGELAQWPGLERKEIILYLEHALRCNPEGVDIYERLLALYDPERQVHLCIRAFLYFFSQNRTQAQEYYEKARRIASNHPLVHLAYLSQLDKKQTQERLAIYRMLANIPEKEAALTYLRKTLISEQPSDFKQYIAALLRAHEHQKAEKVYLDLSDLLIKNRSYMEGIEVLREAISNIREASPFFERLFIIFTALNEQDHSHEAPLKDIMRKLGAIYEREMKPAEAERIYRIAYEKFREFESSSKLANMLQQQNKTSESVRIYYILSETAFYNEEFSKVMICFSKIKQYDPTYQTLTGEQKQFLFTQYYLAKLATRIEEPILDLPLK